MTVIMRKFTCDRFTEISYYVSGARCSDLSVILFSKPDMKTKVIRESQTKIPVGCCVNYAEKQLTQPRTAMACKLVVINHRAYGHLEIIAIGNEPL